MNLIIRIRIRIRSADNSGGGDGVSLEIGVHGIIVYTLLHLQNCY
jgi:hypothetical protein